MTYGHETEAETIAERIRPVLEAAGWGRGGVEGSRIRAETICPGRILLGGQRGPTVSCDLVLEYKGQKLAVIEAKRESISHREGIAQAKDYAQRLDTRFAYASNGKGWYQIDMKAGDEGDMELPFPTPDELWDRTFADKNEWRENFGKVPFEEDGGKWQPRYYQHRAITAAMEAIAQGKDRILLTLATGTGKTSIAFQIAWKLFHSKWNLSDNDRRPRILFLADRNILADQAFNAFSAFDPGALCRINPEQIRRQHGVPRNASVFFTLFQTLMTGEDKPIYTNYPKDFFDFIVIDECHRGAANDESRWRAIMEYFSPAVQLGLTATPKRQHNADTYDYFGEPVYTYALIDGIEDGYLTPFKVRQMASTIDEYVYTGEDEVLQGEVEENESFTQEEFNRRIVIVERERSRVREFMREMNQNDKTLVFCHTQEHAALVRDLINQEKDSDHVDYCHRVTAEDNARGEQHLRNFQDNDKTVPTVLTTSRKLSTGVDARNVRNIVLMRPIRTMIEFKQIIGRGTRTYEDKSFFTIWDFVKAYEHFKDPEWDGEPVEPPHPPPGGREEEPPVPPHPPLPGGQGEEEPPVPPREQLIIKLADGKERTIQYTKQTRYMGRNGQLMSAQEFVELLFGDLSDLIDGEEQLRLMWSKPNERQHFLNQLIELGYTGEVLEEVKALVNAPESDLFDVLNYILYIQQPLTRQQRADNAQQNELEAANEQIRLFLKRILESYIESGEGELSDERLPQHIAAIYGAVSDARQRLGTMPDVREAYLQMQKRLYAA